MNKTGIQVYLSLFWSIILNIMHFISDINKEVERIMEEQSR